MKVINPDIIVTKITEELDAKDELIDTELSIEEALPVTHAWLASHGMIESDIDKAIMRGVKDLGKLMAN